MAKNLYQLILASQSPRREQLLQYLGVDFKISPSSVEEVSDENEPHKLAEDLAYIKAKDIFDNTTEKNPFVIGSDTIVSFENKILGKPANDKDAYQKILSLSDKEHDVITGVSFIFKDKIINFSQTTVVRFKKLTENDINTYLSFNEHLDKAGAYGIQGAAQAFVKEIKGNYSNVVGLPLELMLLKFEELFDKNWREVFE
jgi:septum formation protein